MVLRVHTWRVQEGLRLVQLEQVCVVKGRLVDACKLLKDGHPAKHVSTSGPGHHQNSQRKACAVM